MKTEFDIMFGEGISRTGEIIDMAVALDIVKKSGAWFSYNGSKLGQGRDGVKRVLADNPELAEELANLIREKLDEKRASGKASMSSIIPSSGDEGDEEADVDYNDEDLSGAEAEEDIFSDDFDVD